MFLRMAEPAIPSAPLTLAVTGHRDLMADEVPDIERLLRELFLSLLHRFPDTPLRLLSPLAEGGGRIAARVALELGVELVVPIPFSRENYERDFTAPGSRDEFRELCAQGTIVDVSVYGRDERATETEAAARSLAYAELGIFMCEHAELLIAIWDGKVTGLVGGTDQVVEYHQFGQMSAAPALGNRPARVLAEDDTDLVFHIVCSRDREGGTPAEGLTPGSRRWLIADPDRIEIPDIPPTFMEMVDNIGTFNRDVRLLASGVEPNSEILKGWIDDLTEHGGVYRTARFFACADHLANVFGSRHRRALIGLHVLAVLMGLAFVAYADLDMAPMIYLFLGLFAVGYLLYRTGSRRNWHRKFLDYRALAEGLRVQFYWRLAGVSGKVRNDFAYDNFLQKQDVGMGWIRNVISFTGSPEAGANSPPVEVAIDGVIDCWIGDPERSGQLGYFQNKVLLHERHVIRTGRLVGLCLWLGIATTAVLAVLQSRLPDVAVNAMVVAMGILPLIAAVREAYAHKNAEHELLKQYRFMYRLFREARFRLSRATTHAEKQTILRALGEAALDEHAEWILMHRERPLEPGKL